LAGADPDLGAVLRRLGEPPMWGRRPGFAALVQIILEQQVSLAAARTMYRRLTGHLGAMTPQAVHALQVSGLRDFGLTRQKASYCHGLAARILDGSLDLTAVARAPDDVGRQILLGVPGLGPWSVDIYYLMALRRPDVWPRGDLALAMALREVKRLDDPPTKDEQEVLARAWAPWRSVAARLLWAHYLAARGQYPSRPEDRRFEKDGPAGGRSNASSAAR
jgi:DNA-3-methyladenine glycosylase II